MKQKILSIVLIVAGLVALLVLSLPLAVVPCPGNTTDFVIVFSITPLTALIAAHPRVPVRWFLYLGLLVSFWLIWLYSFRTTEAEMVLTAVWTTGASVSLAWVRTRAQDFISRGSS